MSEKMRLLCFGRNDRTRIISSMMVFALTFASLALAQVTITPLTTPTYQEPVHRAKNLHNLTEEEEFHVPMIVIPTNIRAGKPFRMAITVGKELHEMTEEHHIEWIEVWAGTTRISRTELATGISSPDISVSVSLPESVLLRVFARCNKTGLWEGSIKVNIKQPAVIPKKSGG